MNPLWNEFLSVFRSGQTYTRIIIFNVAIFLAYNVVMVIAGLFVADGLLMVKPGVDVFEFLLAMPHNPLSFLVRPWTVVTYAFFHQGLFHIFFNMLFFYYFARIFTDLLGNKKLLDLYLLAGISGGVLYFLAYNIFPLFQNITDSHMLGASGAVYGVAVATAVLVPNYTFNLILIGPIKIKWIVTFYVFVSFLSITGGNAGGNFAHLGGAIVGFLYMTQLRQGNDWGKPIRWVIDGVMGMFGEQQPKMKVNKGGYGSSYSTSRRSTSNTITTSSPGRPTEDEIDAILDKINAKGYDSLSKAEKQKLFEAGKETDMAYAIDLPIFKGPFDLLLFFIERDELEIHDIPISKITNDFLDYVKHLEELDIELASEFILVAATLMRIKSKMLLPRPELDEAGNEIDPRDDLVAHLLEYKRFKEVMGSIQEMEANMAAREQRGNIAKELAKLHQSSAEESEMEALDIYKLMKYYERAVSRFRQDQNRDIHTIRKYPYTVEDQKTEILNRTLGGAKLDFNKLIEKSPTKIFFVFNFLAILELLQTGKISIQIGDGFNNFWIFRQLETEEETETA